jgi:anti-sigma factor RsiW
MPALTCLTERQIEDYSLGRLDRAAYREAEAHVEACPDCGEALAAADRAADSFVRLLHTPVASGDGSRDEAYQRAAAVVKRLAAVPAGGTGHDRPSREFARGDTGDSKE